LITTICFIALVIDRYYDRLLPLLRQFLRIPNRNKYCGSRHQITFLILCYIRSRLVTLLEVTDAPIKSLIFLILLYRLFRTKILSDVRDIPTPIPLPESRYTEFFEISRSTIINGAWGSVVVKALGY
jgi:hypothetical protein